MADKSAQAAFLLAAALHIIHSHRSLSVGLVKTHRTAGGS